MLTAANVSSVSHNANELRLFNIFTYENKTLREFTELSQLACLHPSDRTTGSSRGAKWYHELAG